MRRRRRNGGFMVFMILIVALLVIAALVGAIISVDVDTTKTTIPVHQTEKHTENTITSTPTTEKHTMPTITPKKLAEIVAPAPGWVNLRFEDTDKSESIAIVVSGELVQVIDRKTNGWLMVLTEENQVGWIYGLYVKEE